MKLARYVFSVLGCYLLAGIAAALVAAGFSSGVDFGSRFLLRVFDLLPAVCASGLLVGFSLAFGKLTSDTPGRFSVLLLRYSKIVLIAAFICTVLCFLAAEVGMPLVQRHCQFEENKKESFAAYFSLAQKYAEQETPDYIRAQGFINQAIEVFPSDQKALDLKRIIDEKAAANAMPELFAGEPAAGAANAVSEPSARTVHELMEKAEAARDAENWFDAHYYAEQAYSLAPSNDGNRAESRQLANEAWHMLSDASVEKPGEQQDIYRQKLAGYKMLFDGDILRAYYLYRDLISRYPKDPDIMHFYEVAGNRLLTQYFFTDETHDMQVFEQYRNVYFICRKNDGSRDVVFCNGIASWRQNGDMIHYLRDFYVYSYDAHDVLTKSLYAPLAKMTAVPADTFPVLPFTPEKKSGTGLVPYVLLKSVDRENDRLATVPVYTWYSEHDDARNMPLQYVMPVSYADFLQVCDASAGADYMPLSRLFHFAERAASFGYSHEVFAQVLIRRVSYPLFMMIVFVLVAVPGWNYRTAYKAIFKFKWLAALPVFTLLSYILLDCITYLQTFLYYALLGFLGVHALYIVVLFYAVALVAVTVYFSALRGAV